MNIAEASWLILLPGVAVLAILVGLAGVWHRRRLKALFAPTVFERVLPVQVRGRRVVRDVLSFLGLALAIVALAEPRFDKQIRTVETKGTDLVLLLDLSRSMDARDVDPSRLERARREIQDLGRMAAGDRVGLVVYAGGAYARLPLTEDYRALALVAEEMSTATFRTQGSDLAAAIRAGVSLLTRSQNQAGQALVVLSDGETHDAEAAMEAARAADELGIPIYGMGIGIEPSPIPLANGSQLQHQGKTVVTTPDFTVLEEVARATGGGFVRSNASDRDMNGLYEDLRSNVTAVHRSSQQREMWRTAFHWPLSAAALFLLFAAWLGDGRRLFGAAAALLLTTLATVSSVAHAADPFLEADERFRAGEFAKAVEMLTEVSLERPDDPEVFDRLGAARYRAEDWEGAARAYDQAAELRDDAADAHFNSGNAHYQAGQLDEAIERYQKAMQADPKHGPASQNHDLVVREIEARRQVQPPPPPPQEGGEGEESESDDQQQPDQPQPQPQPQGEGDQEPQDSEPSDPSDDAPPEDSKSPSGSPQSESESDQEGTSEQVAPEELDGSDEPEGDPTTAAAGSDMGEDQGPITKGQAHRLLDAIEEGNRPLSIEGGRGEKPW